MPRVADTRVYQVLQARFPEVIPEWDAGKDSEDAFDTEVMYSPRIDFAIGPFNRHWRRNDELREAIVRTGDANSTLINRLKTHSYSGTHELLGNWNPRCFLAIEIERKTSRKHRLGGEINAAALGLYGIMIAPNHKVFESLKRIRRYLDYLEDVRKMQQPRNILVIKRADFLATLRA